MRKSVAIAVGLTASAALAGWRTFSAPGPVTDVLAYDAGVYVVATTAGAQAWAVQADGGAALVAGTGALPFIGAGLFQGSCVAGVTGQNLQYSTACGTNGLATTVSATIGAFRVAPGGRAFAVSTTSPGTQVGLYSGVLPVSPLPPLVAPVAGRVSRVLAVGTVNGRDVGVWVEGLLGSSRAWVSVDGAAAVTVPLDAGVTDLSVFDSLGLVGAVAVTDDGQVLVLPDLLGAAGFTSAVSPAPAVAAAFTLQLGDAAGAGFGLAITDGGALLSPIPDPSNPAGTWVLRGGTPSISGGRVHCVDPRFCVTSGAGSSVHAYFNEAPPTVSVALASSDGGAALLVADAGDPDGDPVFVTWSSNGPGLTPGTSPFGLEVGVALAGVCAGARITAVASDGWAAHVQSAVLDLPGGPPGAPVVSPASQTVVAGDSPVTFTASAGSGCPGQDFLWSGDAGTSDGGALSWIVPAAWCSPDAGVLTEQVVALNGAGASAPTAVTLTVLPWGRADAPQFPPDASQDAGTTKLWAPTDLGHPCATSAGFPGTGLRWVNVSSTGTGVLADAGPDGLWVAALEACASGRVTGDAFRSVDGGAPSESLTAGHLQVAIEPNLAPLGPGTAFALSPPVVDVPSATASGTFSTDANCPDLRGLVALVGIWQDGGEVVPARAFAPLSLGWQISGIPGGCSGGAYTVEATLTADGGALASARQPFTMSGAPVAIDGAGPAQLPAQCGLGVQGALTVALAPGSCSAVGYAWAQTFGPPLEPLALDGGQAWVQSVDRGFEALGERLTFEVAVDAGAGNGASWSHAVQVVAEPFVAVAGEVHPSPVREEESAQVVVTLLNTTACAVQGVEVRLALTDLAPVGGSVLLDGQPVEAVTGAGQVVVSGLALGGEQRRRLELRARPRLLARPSVAASAWVREVEISMGPPAPPGQPCGCGSLEGGAALAALALAALRRRRR